MVDGKSIDRENAITNLEQNIRWIEDNEHHQFPGWGNVVVAMRDAVELLKEQEAVTEYVMDDYYQPTCKACGFRPYVMYIPTLEWMRERGFKYCPQCGRQVKWNA